MGNSCTSKTKQLSPFDSMMKNYQQDITKMIAVEKSQEMLNNKVDEVKQKVTQKSQTQRQETLDLIDKREEDAGKRVDSGLMKIQEEQPGSIKKAQAIYRKPARQFLGFAEIRQKFANLKKEVNDEFDKRDQQFTNEIDNQKEEQEKNLNSQKPSIPALDQLPEDQKQRAFKEGEKKFEPQIKQQQEKTKQQIEQKINVDKYVGKFKKIDKSDKIEGFFDDTDEIISKAKGMIVKQNVFC